MAGSGTDVVVIDSGMGNLGSIANMLKRAGVSAAVTSDPDAVASATKLILPGVGAFDDGITRLRERGLVELLERKVRGEGAEILGICLGAQLLFQRSAEGREPGLGWIEGEVRRFSAEDAAGGRLRVPHMGWNVVTPRGQSRLFQGAEGEQRFYFAHSYYMQCKDPRDILATTSYGVEFASAVRRDNIQGVQFHPEKSHRFGLELLRRFVRGA